MPTGHQSIIGPIVDILMDRAPQSVLELGIGFGKWGALIREYLDWFGLTWETGEKEGRYTYLVGIEAYERYKTALWNLYHIVINEDILTAIPTLKQNFEMSLLVDVLEHFTREEGYRVLDMCLEKSQEILICTPFNSKPGTQKLAFGNKFEEHKSQWLYFDFDQYATIKDLDYFFRQHDRSIICLLIKRR